MLSLTLTLLRWLSENEDDGEIEKELFPVEDTTEYLVKVPYQVILGH